MVRGADGLTFNRSPNTKLPKKDSMAKSNVRDYLEKITKKKEKQSNKLKQTQMQEMIKRVLNT